jgi:hypothetical protein
VGLRDGLNTEARGKIFFSAGDPTPVVQSVVRRYRPTHSEKTKDSEKACPSTKLSQRSHI